MHLPTRLLPLVGPLVGACLVTTPLLAQTSPLALPARAGAPATLSVGDIRCATAEPTADEAATLAAAAAAWAQQHAQEATSSIVTVPIAWHVITNGSTPSQGHLTQDAIEAQVQVLNDAFLTSGFQFTLAHQAYVENATWWTAEKGSSAEVEMKSTLALDPAVYLNVYSNDTPTYLGWATFPGPSAETDPYQGVLVHFQTVPGGTYTPYHLGDTLVHEAGHWVGLYHTFQGGCSGAGDSVADTPAVKSPNYGCPTGRDSCPSDGQGPDQIENFMDYVDDGCMDRFTPGQAVRAKGLMETYRPTIVANGTSVGTSIVVDGSRGSRYFGPPAEGVTVDDLAAQNLVRGVPGYYPGAGVTLWTEYDAVAGEWVPSAGAGEVLELGKAFRWYLLDRDGVGDPAISESVALPFTLGTELEANAEDLLLELDTSGNRFNVLANPFGRSLDLSGATSWPGGAGIRSAIYVYDEPTASWEVASGPIAPWEAFRFRARGPRRNGNPRLLIIPAPGQGSQGASTREAPPAAEAAPQVAFRLEGRDELGRPLTDGMLTLAFSGGASPGFSMDEDVEKFQPPSTAYALLGARVGGELLGHDARPLAEGAIPLALEARGAAGEFVLSWDASALPAGPPVTLVDLATGADVDVRAASSYTFEAASRPALDDVPLRDLADGAEATDRFVLRIGDGLAAVEAPVAELGLEAPAPNPTSGAARVAFALPEASAVRLAVYDVRGREVAVLVDGGLEAGRHEAALDAGALSAGVYMVRLEAAGHVLTRRATVAR